MKKLLFLLSIFCSTTSFCQKEKATYQFLAPVYNDDQSVQFKKGHNVYVTDVDSLDSKSVSFVYYKFVGSGKKVELLNNMFFYDTQKQAEIEKTQNDGSKNRGDSEIGFIKTHRLPLNKFKDLTAEVYTRFKGVSAGVFTVPFKIRMDDFDFEQNVNIGMNLSFPIRTDRLKFDKDLITPTVGIGLATVNLNPKNSNLETSDNEEANRTASAFSCSVGLMYQFTNSINIGFQYGVDFLGNNDKDVNWKYDKKPWLGIGINIGVSLSENKNANPNN
ncbi:hypothetical protein ABI125_07105 [Tamlana crocina]|uniref:Outer membrane protein beta-barrel domain-containing protein n=1 Tax=Tamlana crocina TaxID=393006 RepID=A0ABX1DDB2_9FLAO|nr:hypothetical protein [Tamlana crocina]NJX16344.1 hypothetical protein [Tamlana crocina]